MSLGVRAQKGSCKDQRSPGHLWLHLQWSVPAAGVRPQPWGLICAGAAAWDTGIQGWLLGQTEFLSPAAGGVYLGHGDTFPLNGPLPCSGGSGSRMSVGVSAQSVCLRSVCPAIYAYIYVCM